MGKKHSKEKSAEKRQKRAEKLIRERKRKMHSQCRHIIGQMHEAGRNTGIIAWYGFKKGEEEPVVLQARFITNGRVNHPILDSFIKDLRMVTTTYVKRMTPDNVQKDTPYNIVRTMATIIWNQVQNGYSSDVWSELEEESE